ncbi:MAG: hypothetical protein AB1Z98_33595 [Nannocystaceae bacterium]
MLPPPYIDERLVRPETREEMVRGQLIHAAPAKPEHGDRHAKVESVIDAHVAPGYISSVDLLTRAGPRSDFATDTCVRRDGIDPRTGSRYLEELAFEIVNEQSMRHMTVRAEDLTACGVRRLIGVFVKKGEVRQWSGELGRWVPLDLDDVIDDPTLARPVPVRALLDAAAAADAVVGAFEAKGHPRFEQIHDQGLRAGLLRGIEAVSELLGLPLDTDRRAQLERLDPQQLEAWLARIKAERRWPGEDG